jgi:sulfite exporter TauE/SafE
MTTESLRERRQRIATTSQTVNEMDSELTLLAALTAGLVGSSHCVAMCGGIAAALGVSARQSGAAAKTSSAYVLLFSLGRVTGYALIGALAGLAGQGVAASIDIDFWALITRMATGLLLVAIGLQVAFHVRLLAAMERSGSWLWARLAPLARQFLPPKRFDQAFALGFLWGWLPCGLVYSMVLMAILVGDWRLSALLMVAFGVGTMPAMVIMGLASSRLRSPGRGATLKRLAGLALILFGVWTAAQPVVSAIRGGHHQHAGHSTMIEDSRQAPNGTAGLNTV